MTTAPQRMHAQEPAGLSRRTFVGFVLGGGTLVVAADLTLGAAPSYAVVPSPPSIPETYDLEDLQTDSARPTANLITIMVKQGRHRLLRGPAR
ncbi:MAG: hypothetical protein ABI873_14820 [Marmoricola sp.]